MTSQTPCVLSPRQIMNEIIRETKQYPEVRAYEAALKPLDLLRITALRALDSSWEWLSGVLINQSPPCVLSSIGIQGHPFQY